MAFIPVYILMSRMGLQQEVRHGQPLKRDQEGPHTPWNANLGDAQGCPTESTRVTRRD